MRRSYDVKESGWDAFWVERGRGENFYTHIRVNNFVKTKGIRNPSSDSDSRRQD